VIWCHAASVGELRSLSALAPVLSGRARVLVTTATATGAARVSEQMPPVSLHQFQPADTPAASERFLDHWDPALAVFAESDMPPNMLRALNSRGIPAALVAARPSKTRKRAPRTVRALLARFDLITAASPAVADELRALGLKIAATEDLKAQASQAATPPNWPSDQSERPIWLAASVHPEDDPLVFEAHSRLLQDTPQALLLVAPRHPRDGRGWLPGAMRAVFASDSAVPDNDTQVFVMDQMGRMAALHALSAVSYMGGANGQRGGHSPWEAARAGNHIITGPDIANNKPAFDRLAHVVVHDAAGLADAVRAAWAEPRPAPRAPETGGETARALLTLLSESTAP
jgi:3-deoxy-D-manno-octulosonic-acid transferase